MQPPLPTIQHPQRHFQQHPQYMTSDQQYLTPVPSQASFYSAGHMQAPIHYAHNPPFNPYQPIPAPGYEMQPMAHQQWIPYNSYGQHATQFAPVPHQSFISGQASYPAPQINTPNQAQVNYGSSLATRRGNQNLRIDAPSPHSASQISMSHSALSLLQEPPKVHQQIYESSKEARKNYGGSGEQQSFNTEESARQQQDSTMTQITFNVRCITNPHESVSVVGSHPCLGNWDSLKAVEMFTDTPNYPWWKVTVSVPSRIVLEYKFVKMKTTPDGMKQFDWEQLITGNRKVETFNRSKVVLTEEFSDASMRREEILASEPPLNCEAQQVASTQAQAGVGREHIQTTVSFENSGVQRHQTEKAPQSYRLDLEPQKLQKQETVVIQPIMTQQIDTVNLGPATLNLASPTSQEIIQHPMGAPRKELTVRKKLKQQLTLAFPKEMALTKKRFQERTNSNESDFSSTQEGNNAIQSMQKLDVIAKKNTTLKSDNIESLANVKLDSAECVVLCTYSLPYKLRSNEDGVFTVEKSYSSPAFLYANLDDLAQRKIYNFIWVGIVCTKHKLTRVELQEAKRVLKEKKCYGVFYTEEELKPYLRFYEGLVRPNMHNFIHPEDQDSTIFENWANFNEVNSKIAHRVHELRQELKSNIVWIHGDQFILLPYYIRRHELVRANIGFYFHQAFPASAIFHTFHKRKEFLKSLLESNLIGFHVFEYARNFLNSCQRTLGLQYELGTLNTLSVNYNKRSIQVRVSHIGLDEDFVKKIMEGATFQKEVKKVNGAIRYETSNNQGGTSRLNSGNLNQLQLRTRLNQQHSISQPAMLYRPVNTSITSTVASSQGDDSSGYGTPHRREQRIILSSIDSFHSTTGLVQKLAGYKRFLKNNPDYKDKVTLIQIIRGNFSKSSNMKGQHAPDESNNQNRSNLEELLLADCIPSLKILKETIDTLVKQIHKEFGQQCLIVKTGNFSIEARLALWSKTQILFVSTLKDGLYLTTFEYIFTKYLKNDFKNSTMLISEFAGCNSQFAGFHEFNPFFVAKTVEALEKALRESPREKEERMKRALTYCQKRTFSGWVENFLKELKFASKTHSIGETRIVHNEFMAVQCAKNIGKQNPPTPVHLQLIGTVPNQLNIQQHANFVKLGRKNLIVIDHEALPFIQFTKRNMWPREEILYQLIEIIHDKNTIVCVMTDQDRHYASQAFEKVLMHHENFWMSSESGFWLMMQNKQEWRSLFHLGDRQWIKTIRTIMEEYCENIDGASVEERSCSIVWNYRGSDGNHGQKAAKELFGHLQQLTGKNSPIVVVQGNGYIEVLPNELTQHKHLTFLFQNAKKHLKQKIESFLYIGADMTDDKDFKFIKDCIEDSKNDMTQVFSNNCKASICVMGKRPSSAPYYIEQKDLAPLLQEIALKSQMRKKNASYTDLLAGQKNEDNNIEIATDEEDNSYDDSIEAKQNIDFRSKRERRISTLRPISVPPLYRAYEPEEIIEERKAVDEESVVHVNDVELKVPVSPVEFANAKNSQISLLSLSQTGQKNSSAIELKNVKNVNSNSCSGIEGVQATQETPSSNSTAPQKVAVPQQNSLNDLAVEQLEQSKGSVIMHRRQSSDNTHDHKLWPITPELMQKISMSELDLIQAKLRSEQAPINSPVHVNEHDIMRQINSDSPNSQGEKELDYTRNNAAAALNTEFVQTSPSAEEKKERNTRGPYESKSQRFY